MTDDEIALAWFTARVEHMSVLPAQRSQIAYTHRRTAFVAFCNGILKPEGAPAPACVGYEPAVMFEMVEATLTAVRAYRAAILGPALLTWRAEPELSRDGDKTTLYCRLAFEADLWGTP